jgi:RimJ/RimL family protein N-acetyltransferase
MSQDAAPGIKTPRVDLRCIDRRDAPRIAQLCQDPQIPRMSLRMPWPYTEEEASAFARRAETQDRRRDQTFAIDHPENGLIGVVGFFHDGDLGPEVGYWMGGGWRGRGLATEALNAALGWVVGAWGCKAVVTGHFDDNPASGRVLCKAGFLYTGVVRVQRSAARGEDVRVRRMIWLA